MPTDQTAAASPNISPEDMFYGGLYWVWDDHGLGLRTATPGESASEIKRLRAALCDVERKTENG